MVGSVSTRTESSCPKKTTEASRLIDLGLLGYIESLDFEYGIAKKIIAAAKFGKRFKLSVEVALSSINRIFSFFFLTSKQIFYIFNFSPHKWTNNNPVGFLVQEKGGIGILYDRLLISCSFQILSVITYKRPPQDHRNAIQLFMDQLGLIWSTKSKSCPYLESFKRTFI